MSTRKLAANKRTFAQFMSLAHPPRRRALLASTAFTGAFIAVIAGHPQSALAACAVTAGPNTVICNGTTTTTNFFVNIDATNNPSTDRQQVFTTGPVTGTVNGTVDGAGLSIFANQAGAPISFTNNGAVTTNQPENGLVLGANAGTVTYSGNGSVSNTTNNGVGLLISTTSDIVVGTSGTPVTPNFRGTSGLQTLTAAGQTSVQLSGGTITSTSNLGAGLALAAAGSGSINATLTGNTSIVNASGISGNRGIAATSTTGSITITSDANIGSSGATTRFGTGISAQTDGPITITQTGGAIFAGGSALQALGVSGPVNVSTAAGSSVSGGIAIIAWSNGAGDVKVTSGGTVTAVNDGIQARHFVGGAGNVTVDVAAGSAISAAFRGILATNSGSGRIDATVGAGATVAGGAGSSGISIFGGGTNVLTNSGTISGGTGVDMDGTGGTVTNFGSIIGTGGSALQLSGGSNLFVMSGPGATLTGNAFGSGTDTFRFAGSDSNAFNVAQIRTGWALVDKTGSSNWTLTGTSTYAGPVTVNGGTLSVNGNLASASSITVNSGGTLGGTGTVGNTTINAGGALAPGNSIGTINITGNLNFVGAGNYVVEVSGTASDKTVVSGTATLGGTVQVVPLTRVTTRTTYTILSGSPVSGTFGSATVQAGNNFARNPVLAYVGGDVLLTLDPGLLAPSLAGGTPNQRAVTGAVDTALTGGNPLSAFDPLFSLNAAQLPGALDQLSGEVHASTAGVLADESLYARSAILGRLRQASYSGNASMAALSTGGPQAFAAEAGEPIEGALAYGKSPGVKAPMRAPAATSDIVFWAQGFGAWGRFNGDGNAATVRRDLAGVFTGVDTRVGDAGRIGIAAGYTGSKNNIDGRGGANVETGHIAGYGGWNFGALTLRAGGDFAFHSIATDRTINFAGFFDRTFANYDGRTGQVFGELGYGFALANIAIEPFAGAAWVRVKTDGTAERGGAAALTVAGTTFETGYTTLGIRAAGMVPIGHDMILVPRGTLAWQHAFDDVTPYAALAFQVAPAAPFTISGVPIARDALLAEAALDLAIGRNATIGISYTGQIASNVTDHAAKGRFSWRF